MSVKSPWIDVCEQLPAEGELVDVWFDVYASPLSFGMADQWCEPNAWREKKKWFHRYKGEKAELQSRYITHWKPLGDIHIEGPDSVIWQAAGLASI